MNEPGTVELYRERVVNGGHSTYGGETPTKASTAQYNYTHSGWSLEIGGEADPNATKNVDTNRVVYAAFTKELRSYTVTFSMDGTVLESMVVPYGTVPVPTVTPTKTDHKFSGWNPALAPVTGDVDYVAQFVSTASLARKLVDKTVASVTSDASSVGSYAFRNCSALTTVDLPLVTSIGGNAFNGCSNLTTVDLPLVTSVGSYAFYNCKALTTVILRSETMCTLSNVNAFNSTPIKSGTGYIYVPSALVDSYKADSKWSTYANQFRAIEDYSDICGGGV